MSDRNLLYDLEIIRHYLSNIPEHTEGHQQTITDAVGEIRRLQSELAKANRKLELFAEITNHNEQWIDKYTKDIEQLTERVAVLEEVKSALSNLCSLKQHKDKHGKDTFYLEEQPKAWEKANNALKSD